MRILKINLFGLGLISIVLVASSGVTFSDEASKNQQEALQAELEHSLVAPCCWNMTVDQHESAASHEVRKKIAAMIKQGKSKDEILNAFVKQYGERILASPSQKSVLGKLAFWLIPIALVIGMLIVGKTINRLTSIPKKQDKRPGTPKQKEPSSHWDKRVEEELKDFE
ncbi:MAG: cytochrome c-type biogenesis protein CcmH [bacterium]